MSAQSSDGRGPTGVAAGGSPARRAGRLFGYVLAVASLAWVGRALAAGWEASAALLTSVRPLPLALSAVVLALALLALTLNVRLVFRSFGPAPPLRATLHAFWLSNLGRYVPGKVWTVAGWVALLGAVGVAPARSVLVLVVANVLSVVTGLLLASAAAAGGLQTLGVPAWVPLAATAALAAGLHPAVVRGAAALAGRLSGREVAALRPQGGPLLAAAGGYALNWIGISLAFGAFVQSLAGGSAAQTARLGSAFPAAYLAGYLAIVAPGGLGVREAALTALLTPALGPGPAAAVAVAARLWFTAVEVLVTGAVAVAGPGEAER